MRKGSSEPPIKVKYKHNTNDSYTSNFIDLTLECELIQEVF
jgi:hypothetical protein